MGRLVHRLGGTNLGPSPFRLSLVAVGIERSFEPFEDPARKTTFASSRCVPIIGCFVEGGTPLGTRSYATPLSRMKRQQLAMPL